MSETEAAAEIVPETPTEEALADAAEKIVKAIESPGIRTRHNILSVMRAYEFMRANARGYTPEECQLTLAIATECRGLMTIQDGNEIIGMGTFWPIENPHVSWSKIHSGFKLDGDFIYIGWCFGVGDWKMWRRLIQHAASIYENSKFVCCTDGRRRIKGNRVRGSGRVLVREIHRKNDGLGRMMGIANG